ncbi:hypothetical protein ABKN59_011904 [Abortiporus biennis]
MSLDAAETVRHQEYLLHLAVTGQSAAISATYNDAYWLPKARSHRSVKSKKNPQQFRQNVAIVSSQPAFVLTIEIFYVDGLRAPELSLRPILPLSRTDWILLSSSQRLSRMIQTSRYNSTLFEIDFSFSSRPVLIHPSWTLRSMVYSSRSCHKLPLRNTKTHCPATSHFLHLVCDRNFLYHYHIFSAF